MRKWIIASVFGLAIIMLAGCGSSPIGDGGSINMKKDGFTINSSDDQQGKVDITVNDDGEMLIKGTDESGEKFEQKVTKEQKLPDGFPQDIPIPEGVELDVIESDMTEGIQFIISYTVEGKVIDFYDQYRDYVEQAGYTTIIDASGGNAKSDTVIENIMAKSEGKTLTISIMNKGTGKYDDGTVTVNMMYLLNDE